VDRQVRRVKIAGTIAALGLVALTYWMFRRYKG
jgi:hypothetical protein